MDDSFIFLEKLALRTINYLSNDLLLEGVKKEFNIVKVDNIELLDISTMINVSGLLKGTTTLSVTSEFALKMVQSSVYGEIPIEVLSELAVENIAETLNIVLGNILVEYDGLEDEIEIGTPQTVQKRITVTKNEYKKIYLCVLKCEQEQIILSYFE